MQKIYKYKLDIVDKQILALPVGSRVLSVTNQNEELMLYALVDTSISDEYLDVYVKGTGHETDNGVLDELQFVGTVQLMNGSLVLHVFTD